MTCPVPNCPREVPRGKLLCLVHWIATPVPLQRDVLISWRNLNAAKGGTAVVRASKRYRAAKDAAISAATSRAIA
jgi:hypothetical protein